MDWHEIFWLNQAEHEFLLLLATVSRGVDVVNLAVDNLYTSFGNDVNQLVLLVASTLRISMSMVTALVKSELLSCATVKTCLRTVLSWLSQQLTSSPR